MAIQKRTTAAPVAAVAPPVQYQTQAQIAMQTGPQSAPGPNFMDLGFYTGGFLIPQGAYVITEAIVRMFKGDKGNSVERLGGQLQLVPLADPRAENKKEQFYSFGSSAHLSFMPNADGSGIVPIPGAPSQTLPDSTNWAMLLKSLYNCGLPQGYANNIKSLEGVWVYIVHVDEPAERAGFQSATSEVGAQQRTGPKKIAVVGEILDGGRPWEGGGGWPDKPVANLTAHASTTALSPGAATVGGYINGAANAAPPTSPAGSLDYRTDGMDAIYQVIDKETQAGRKTVLRAKLRNDVFNSLSPKLGQDTAGTVLTQVFDTPGVLESVLGDLGYKLAGAMVVPV